MGFNREIIIDSCWLTIKILDKTDLRRCASTTTYCYYCYYYYYFFPTVYKNDARLTGSVLAGAPAPFANPKAPELPVLEVLDATPPMSMDKEESASTIGVKMKKDVFIRRQPATWAPPVGVHP